MGVKNSKANVFHHRHARFIDEDVVFHIISRVFQGRHLLVPDRDLNSIIVGVIGRAQELFPEVELFAAAFMSNHMHMMLRGKPRDVPAFIGFIKREISRRWGGEPRVNWPGTMWHGYLATALPTQESQEHCLKYVLSQGAKEHLVKRPQDWPGVHAAKPLLTGRNLQGTWLDASGYARARDAEKHRRKPRHVKRSTYISKRTVAFRPLPSWSHLDRARRQAKIQALLKEIEEEAREERAQTGRTVKGPRAVVATSREHRTRLPKIPWLARRRRMICWANQADPAVIDYVQRYWAFQEAFREASLLFHSGSNDAQFPEQSLYPRRGSMADH